jgi:hypothetical protein
MDGWIGDRDERWGAFISRGDYQQSELRLQPQRTVLVRPRRTRPCATEMSTVAVFFLSTHYHENRCSTWNLNTTSNVCIPQCFAITNNVEPHPDRLSLASNPNRHSIKRAGWICTNRPRVRSAAADSFIASKSVAYIQFKTRYDSNATPLSSARAQDDIRVRFKTT